MKRFLFLFTVFFFLSCRQYGNRVEINANSHVYYKGTIREAEARKLGNFLLLQGYFNTSDERAVQLLKKGNGYLVRFIVNEAVVNQDRENTIFSFEVWRDWMAERVFENSKVSVELVNDRLKKIAEVRQEPSTDQLND